MSNLSVDDAISLCEEICDMVDDLPERAEEFGDSVKTKTLDIQQTIEQKSCVTDAQQNALENMRNGCQRWLG